MPAERLPADPLPTAARHGGPTDHAAASAGSASPRTGAAGPAPPTSASRSGRGAPPRGRRRGRRRRSATRAALAVLAVVLVALAAWAVLDLRRASAALRAAESAAGRAQAALLDGDVAAADEAFAEAGRAFADAGEHLDAGGVRAVGVVPVASRNLDAVEGLARAGGLVAAAGGGVTSAVLDLPGGDDALAPSGGQLPVEQIAALAPALREAADRVREADRQLAATPARLLVPPVADARDAFARRLTAVREPVRAGGALAEVLPAYLGLEGPRRYFFGAQNPAEARGTGGLIGAWTVLTVDAGTLEFGSFDTIGTLTLVGRAAYDVPPPTPDYGARYGRFAAAGHGSNINMTPDFPTAAQAILDLYELRRGDTLDGVIVADPYALQALLRLTGGVEVPGVRAIDATTVVDFLTSEQYAAFPEDGSRKPVLGDVAQSTLQAFLQTGSGNPARSLQALGATAGDGHLLLHSVHEREQEAFITAGVAGAFRSPAADLTLGVVLNNAAANKVDASVEQRQRHEVWLDGDGDAFVRTTTTLQNTVPAGQPPSVVLGPQVEGLAPGDTIFYVSTYCGPTCALQRFVQDGDPVSTAPEQELGLLAFPRSVTLPAASTTELVYEWVQRDAWDGERFHLSVPGQPSVRPTTAEISVHPPLDHELTTPGGVATPLPDGGVRWEQELGAGVSVAVQVRSTAGPLAGLTHAGS